MINIKPQSTEISIQKALKSLNVSDKKAVEKTLHQFALKGDEQHSNAYKWISDNWGRKEVNSWHNQYQKNKQILEEKQADTVWRKGLNPLQRGVRFMVGVEKKLPEWLGGVRHPKEAAKDDAILTAEMWKAREALSNCGVSNMPS